MLMRLAEEFDFRIKAFHHGVEAYKVAPELAEHGVPLPLYGQTGVLSKLKLMIIPITMRDFSLRQEY